ncbi:MAG: PAS domain S-box protein [Syntrophobacteraceae bacterium]
MKIRRKVFLVAFIPAALAAVVLIALSWHLGRQVVSECQRSESRAHIGVMCQQVSTRFAGIQAVLAVEARRLLPGEPDALLTELRDLEGRLGPSVGGVFLDLPDGEAMGTRGERFTTRDRYYYPLLRQGVPVITRIIAGGDGGQQVLVLAPRMGQDGEYLGALGAAVPVSDLLQTIRDFSPGNAGGALLVDDTGRVEASGVEPATVSGLLPQVLAAERGEAGADVAGVPNHLVFTCVQGTPWKLALLRPYRDIPQFRRQMLMASVLVLLVTLSMGSIGYLLLRRMVSQPLRRLIEAHAALAEGGRSVGVESPGQDEFAALAASCNRMAERLRRSEGELQRHEQARAAIVDNIPGVVFRFFARPDGGMGLSFVGERSQEILGVAAAPYETFFERFLERLDLEQRGPFLASIEVAVRERRPWSFEGTLFFPVGEKKWLHARSLPTASGEELLFDGVVLNVTDSKRAEESLREREERLQEQNAALLALVSRGTLFQADLQQSVAEITEACSALIGTERVSVWLYSEDYAEIRCIDVYRRSDNQHASGETLRSEDFPDYTAIHRKGEIIAAVDVYADSRTREIPAAYYREHGIHSLLDAPVWLHDRLGALLSMERVGEERGWTLEDERLATNMAALLSLCFEANERRQAEEALRTSEVKLRSLFAAMRDVVIVLNAQGRYVEIAPTATDLLYRPPNELLGKTLAEVLPEELADRFMESIHEVLDQGSRRSLDYLMEIAGDPVWFSAGISPYTSDSVLWVARDITERKRMEDALRESETKFKTMAETSPLAIYMSVGMEQKAEYINPTFTKLFGYTLEDVPSVAHWWPLAYPDETHRKQIVEEWNLKIRRAIETKSDIEPMEVVVTCKDGSQKYILWGFIGIGKQNLAFGLDLTERKRAEEEREKLQAQLTQSQKMESVGRLAGGVAHDFNNMLGVILGHTELALLGIGPDEQVRASLQEVQKAAHRSADLTRQLLAFASKQTVAPKVIDLNEAVEGMLRMLRRLIGEDIDLAWLPGAKLGPVYMDPSQIDQILVNLSVNARDAIAGTGRLMIETGKVVFDEDYCARHAGFVPGEFILLAVSDDGCGMDRETLANIFEPFFTTKEMGKGTGLGLATVHGIVKQNNGFINVHSEPGCGTTFKIYLPRHAAGAAPRPEEAPAAAAEPGSATILLVEDEPAMLEVTAIWLRMLGYSVLTAATPGEAIRLAREYTGRIDLLMTDVVMPEMNGRDLARKLVSIHPDIRRLFMSGYTANVIAHQGVLDEGVHFLQKPFSMQALAARVREVLGDGQGDGPARYRTAGLSGRG